MLFLSPIYSGDLQEVFCLAMLKIGWPSFLALNTGRPQTAPGPLPISQPSIFPCVYGSLSCVFVPCPLITGLCVVHGVLLDVPTSCLLSLGLPCGWQDSPSSLSHPKPLYFNNTSTCKKKNSSAACLPARLGARTRVGPSARQHKSEPSPRSTPFPLGVKTQIQPSAFADVIGFKINP